MIKPHGSETLNPLFIEDAEKRAQLIAEAASLPSITICSAAAGNAVMMGSGYFNPLTGYMNKADAIAVAKDMHTANGLFWPTPVLNMTDDASAIKDAKRIALRDPNIEGNPVIAIQDIEAIEEYTAEEMKLMSDNIFRTDDMEHPGVKAFNTVGRIGISGPIQVLNYSYFDTDFPETFRTAVQIRDEIEKLGWETVVAFQTRNPMHRAHFELTLQAARELETSLLIHPVVGMTKPGDVDHYTRVRCYQALIKYYPRNTAVLSLLPLAMRLAGPREAVWHAIIRKNYGCTHFIVGRDHAGPGRNSNGEPFYGPQEAHKLLGEVKGSLDIEIVKFEQMVYVAEQDK